MPSLAVGGHLTGLTGLQASRSVKLTLDLMSLDTMLTEDSFVLQGHHLNIEQPWSKKVSIGFVNFNNNYDMIVLFMK